MEVVRLKKSNNFEPNSPVGTVAELFAGVGGFRLGLAKAGWKTVFSNQWEPSTKIQHASNVYIANFGPSGHVCADITKIEKIPVKFNLLVGGFPCQDYSVAKSLNRAKGLRGKKGVLWWEILRLVKVHKPKYVFLENVDRLLKSPATQRGRDFAVMLRTLGDEGYIIEWRVVNAAEYGFPQRRIRVFIIATRVKGKKGPLSPDKFILEDGVLARAFPHFSNEITPFVHKIETNLEKLSNTFNKKGTVSPFLNSGVYFDGFAYTMKTKAVTDKITFMNLGDVLQNANEVDESFMIPDNQLKEWKFLKGAKSIERTHKGSGAQYRYSEGAMAFPDLLSNPSRTILTGEGGSSPSRFKHIIKTESGYRRLTPIELERLSGFPDNWTLNDYLGKRVGDTKRAFFMGNALVVGLITRVGKILAEDFKQGN